MENDHVNFLAAEIQVNAYCSVGAIVIWLCLYLCVMWTFDEMKVKDKRDIIVHCYIELWVDEIYEIDEIY